MTPIEVAAGNLLTILNHGYLTLMISIGHQARLFDTMNARPAATSDEIAHAAGLNERYVREWLGAMTVGGIVRYDPSAETYVLPEEHGALLSRAAGPDNLASLAQMLPLLSTVEQQVLQSFRAGGGVPYSEYTRFHELMAELSAATNDAALLPVIVPLVPGFHERLTNGISVADIGCGSGHALNLLGREYPRSTFTGFDFADEAISAAKREAHQMGLPNTDFIVRDVSELGEVNRFDVVFAFDAIHDQAHPARVLNQIFTALKPGGTFVMVDIRASSRLEDNLDHPLGVMLYTVSTAHCMTVSLALGGEGLGTAWGEQKATEMLTEAGFTGIEIKHVDQDILNSYYLASKPAM
ncbi:class I SAM-dependent methyltransferase [Hoyosella altamirensis]|uniref:SAM-dependent methyltransferase n=1 Tax=Hoyosella altamirensis TaxID=616997 RepID=A0A839RL89_9ACTN|nr:class I SAM-dependent methyltransferase [Hoyosella altamirensis]MBB3036751.1 SAM-dependent methyltransferase [Hoyosella altamirensis]